MRENFVQDIDGVDGLRIRVGHTFHLHTLSVGVCIHSEQALKHALVETVLDLEQVLVIDVFARPGIHDLLALRLIVTASIEVVLGWKIVAGLASFDLQEVSL